MDIYNLVSLGGLVALVLLAWALSAHRRRVNKRCVAAGVGLQVVLGALIFWGPYSREVFLWVNDTVGHVLGATRAGQEFVFGSLADPSKVGFVLATQALPLAIVFAALMALLYYSGVMQRIIRAFAWVFTRLMGTSGAESLCAASNIFVGIESATTVRPYLSRMTRSELCTVLTAGMATIASTVLAFYVAMFGETFPTLAGHLISASIMSAPAAIVMSKLLVPETGEPVTLGGAAEFHYEKESSAIEAVINGAMAGMKLVIGIVALLVAFIGLLAIVNLAVAQIGLWCGAEAEWSLQAGLGWVMRPLVYVIGVPHEDVARVADLLGTRLVLTEVPAYSQMAAYIEDGAFVHARSQVVAAYALCGFAHVASLGIFIGGIAALVPERRKDLAAVGPRALLAATLACLMTGAVAGMFFTGA